MESALGVRFENCHKKYLAVVWSKMGVHEYKTGVVDHLIRQTEHVVAQFYPWFKHVLLVFFLTLVNVIHYHDPKQVKLKFGTKTYTPAGILPAFLTFYQLCFRVDFPLLSATPLDTSLNLN